MLRFCHTGGHLVFSLFSYLILRLRRESLVCSRTGLPSANPAGKRNNRLRPTCEMAPPQCLLFHPTSARMKFVRPSVGLTIELHRPSNFFLPLAWKEVRGRASRNGKSISNLSYDEKEIRVNWGSVKRKANGELIHENLIMVLARLILPIIFHRIIAN